MKIKIKDLPTDFQLVGKKLIIPLYVRKKQEELLPIMIIKSGWNKGFWCVKKETDSQIFPIFFENFNEVKEWEIGIDTIDEVKLRIETYGKTQL